MQPKLAFFNLYTRKRFSTDQYVLDRDGNNRPRAVANGDGGEVYRYISEAFYNKYA